jgi:hypothetical protein
VTADLNEIVQYLLAEVFDPPNTVYAGEAPRCVASFPFSASLSRYIYIYQLFHDFILRPYPLHTLT